MRNATCFVAHWFNTHRKRNNNSLIVQVTFNAFRSTRNAKKMRSMELKYVYWTMLWLSALSNHIKRFALLAIAMHTNDTNGTVSGLNAWNQLTKNSDRCLYDHKSSISFISNLFIHNFNFLHISFYYLFINQRTVRNSQNVHNLLNCIEHQFVNNLSIINLNYYRIDRNRCVFLIALIGARAIDIIWILFLFFFWEKILLSNIWVN